MLSRNRFGRTLAVGFGLLLGASLLQAAPASATTGAYDAEYTTHFTLWGHTVYRPVDLPENEDLPIVAWGNGACRADGTWFENILTEFASHGYLVIANGRPGGSGSTDAEMLTDAIDWAEGRNTSFFSEYRGHLDTDSIAVMGQSCGGLETYDVADDPRIDTTVIWNSGMFSDADPNRLDHLHAPIAYFTGGPSDIAYENALNDWDDLPSGLPAFMGHLDVGHYGTFEETDGGEYGQVGVAWLDWQLKGDQTAAQQFVGSNCGLCVDPDWDTDQKNL
ncbi:alpha/beta hydrolase [Nocardiopsis sp. LOL_012]|uniref:alpha/beta hydrolase n=1 Tax=Nocardiopsis sp. LOL_012 TaxID=3345409 RepID=UPI003A83CE33